MRKAKELSIFGGQKMKTKKMIRNQKGFTLIEIIAVLVILGILAAVAIPKYLDMRSEAVHKAASAANTEMNARERLKLAEWKLNDGSGLYPTAAAVACGPGIPQCPSAIAKTIQPVDTILGPDWNGGAAITSGTPFPHQGKTVTFTRTPQPNENEPATWAVTVS
jgi:prepilin-type N-terminal cleavage/methylation domain-containing protein